MKTCTKCNIEQSFNEFSPAKENKDGLDHKCKSCKRLYSKEYRIKNNSKISEKRNETYRLNKEVLYKNKTVLLDSKICYTCNLEKTFDHFHKSSRVKDGHNSSCKECRSIECKTYRDKNLDKAKNYRDVNKEKLNKQRIERRAKDINYRLRCRLRSRLCNAIKNDFKSGSAVSDLGCTIDEFKIYIEKQFKDGMSWENWSKYTWHLDHKTPLASFDLSDRQQLLKAVHYSNMQPLWAIDNLEKGAKF